MSVLLAAESSGPIAFPILSMLIFVPAAGAIIITLLSKRRPEFVRLVAALTSVITGAMSVWLLAEFDGESGGCTVRKAIREKIVFSLHDVARDPPFINLDLVSCRNLLIYFRSDLQRQVFDRFRYALRDEALLFLGSSETVGAADELFAPCRTAVTSSVSAPRASGESRVRRRPIRHRSAVNGRRRPARPARGSSAR